MDKYIYKSASQTESVSAATGEFILGWFDREPGNSLPPVAPKPVWYHADRSFTMPYATKLVVELSNRLTRTTAAPQRNISVDSTRCDPSIRIDIWSGCTDFVNGALVCSTLAPLTSENG